MIVPALDDTSGFAAAVNPIDVLPVPDAPDVIVSHDASDEAFQLQPFPVTFSAAVDAAPSDGTVCAGVGNEYTHSPKARPAWLTAICAVPPFQDTVTVAARADVALFAATTIEIVPVSLPDAGPEKVTHDALDEAAHVQLPDVLVIATLNVPPAAGGDCDVDASEYPHVVGCVGVVSFLLQLATASAAASKTITCNFMMAEPLRMWCHVVRSSWR